MQSSINHEKKLVLKGGVTDFEVKYISKISPLESLTQVYNSENLEIVRFRHTDNIEVSFKDAESVILKHSGRTFFSVFWQN